ncbi:putative anti-sigma regulatory factor (serine/threonine protein kinase) [Prochlorococcus marinus str. MIT 9312]|uniref:Putative anti-sigma regulatory factor (Serine/threonine protein kinase) n=1 Tax=Prochlorococcus marinus (strain MIT 9312) TaxID=74546 RepID=Q31B08_PROM9|nr:ATP-binding protein [Prochlorococcus marinus]ABB49937.1 putative anti-sigma regulatory factor (serine/threonine protein kinase) [Prochlorococcus marinus str. MIT 9312]KGF99068.1 Serine-protein kinase RsbW [Prochlorococcus marinus str. MIT 9311]
MSLFQGKNILIKLFKRPKINWSNYEFESSLQLNEFVDQLLEPINKSQSTYLIKLGLHEALVNAVKHGNKLDSSKSIRVRRIITPNWCVWQIQDRGNGLEKNNRNYKLPIKTNSVNGRGLYIINECFDDIRWSSKGNRLQLALKR